MILCYLYLLVFLSANSFHSCNIRTTFISAAKVQSSCEYDRVQKLTFINLLSHKTNTFKKRLLPSIHPWLQVVPMLYIKQDEDSLSTLVRRATYYGNFKDTMYLPEILEESISKYYFTWGFIAAQ